MPVRRWWSCRGRPPARRGRCGRWGLDPLVRMFRLVVARPVAARPGPLRILVAIAAPLTGGGQVLNYEQELRNVLAAVRQARADVRVVPFATTGEIRAALAAYPAHVLHLSGHSVRGGWRWRTSRAPPAS